MIVSVFLLPAVNCLTVCSAAFELSVVLTQDCAGGKIENNEMDGACSAYGGGERCAHGVDGET
jgi:hypothetical protein